MKRSTVALTLAAALSLLVSAAHAYAIVAGPSAYAFLGAPELGTAEAAGSRVPDLVTAVLVVVFATFGAYALSGAGRIRRLPLLRIGLVLIGAVFTLRGLAVFMEVASITTGSSAVPPRYVVFSLVSLVTGLAFLVGTLPRWRALASS